MHDRFVLAACLATALALPAAAQEHPLMQPSRDVMVEYHVSNVRPGEHRSDTVRMYFTDGGMKMRIEPVGQPRYSVVDRTTGHMTMVMVPRRAYVEVPYDTHRVMTFDATGATFRRLGTDTVAGVHCAVYGVQRQDRSGQVCLADDGLLLRARSDDPVQSGNDLEATSVAYGPQPASLFQPPPGFQQMQMAAVPPGAIGGAGAGRPGAGPDGR